MTLESFGGEEVTARDCGALRSARALCYYSVQGRALRGTVRLRDTDSRFFGRRHLYVGLSRATSGDAVTFSP